MLPRDFGRRCVSSQVAMCLPVPLKNAPSRFQVVLVGIDENDEDGDVDKDIARQYATEKGLKLVELKLSDQAKVEEAFSTVISMIMDSWSGESSDQGKKPLTLSWQWRCDR